MIKKHVRTEIIKFWEDEIRTSHPELLIFLTQVLKFWLHTEIAININCVSRIENMNGGLNTT